MNKGYFVIFTLGLFTGYLLNELFHEPSNSNHNAALANSNKASVTLQDTESSIASVSEQAFTSKDQLKAIDMVSPENIDLAISFASEEAISEFITQQGVLDKDSLLQITDVRAAAQRLTEIVLGQNQNDEVEMLNHGPSRVYFSNGEHAHQGYANQSEFSADIQVITASFETGADHGHKLLVKWIHQDTNQLVAFKNVPIKSAEALHFVKVNKSQWQNGFYSVEVYAISDEFPLLSKGQYTISN